MDSIDFWKARFSEAAERLCSFPDSILFFLALKGRGFLAAQKVPQYPSGFSLWGLSPSTNGISPAASVRLNR
jgi:hypothetical protein